MAACRVDCGCGCSGGRCRGSNIVVVFVALVVGMVVIVFVVVDVVLVWRRVLNLAVTVSWWKERLISEIWRESM